MAISQVQDTICVCACGVRVPDSPRARRGLAAPARPSRLRCSRGAVAQLGERRVRNAKVGSSILLRSTKIKYLRTRPDLKSGLFHTWLDTGLLDIYGVIGHTVDMEPELDPPRTR